MNIKRICFISMILGVYQANLFASSLSSSSYILDMPRIVASGGQASSTGYSIKDARIGVVFGGTSQSMSYNLDASYIERPIATPPNPPTINPVTSPTNVFVQTLSGTKDSDTSIYINGFLAIPLNNDTAWSYSQTLTEGDNILIITARNAAGLDSDAVSVAIVLDIIPPTIYINQQPPENMTNQDVYLNSSATDNNSPADRITITGDDSPYTIDGVYNVIIRAADEAGNQATFNVPEFIIDKTPPSQPTVVDDGATTFYPDRLHAAWSGAYDIESGIAEYEYSIGTSSGGIDTVPWTSSGLLREITHTGLNLISGQTYYFSVKAKNGAGSWSGIASSDGIQVIQTPPSINSVMPSDGSLFEVGDIVSFNIQAADLEGDALFYKIVINGTIVKDWDVAPSYDWYTTTETIGTHNATVYVKDTWNNESSQNIEIYLVRKAVSLP